MDPTDAVSALNKPWWASNPPLEVLGSGVQQIVQALGGSPDTLHNAAVGAGAYRDPNRPIGQTLYDAANTAMMGAPMESRGAGLPMDEAARMARADQMGYTIDAYHGTKSGEALNKFDLRKAGKTDPGLVGKAAYFSPSPEQASAFAESPHYGQGLGPSVMSAKLRLQKPFIIDDGRLPDGRRLTDVHPNGITKQSAAAINKEIRSAGHDGVIFKTGGEPVQYAVFDPSGVRSRFAAFDPAKAKSSNILAGLSVGALIPALLANHSSLFGSQ